MSDENTSHTWQKALGGVYEQMNQVKDALLEKISELSSDVSAIRAELRLIPRYQQPCSFVSEINRKLSVLEESVRMHHAMSERRDTMASQARSTMKVLLIVAAITGFSGWFLAAIEFYIRYKP